MGREEGSQYYSPRRGRSRSRSRSRSKSRERSRSPPPRERSRGRGDRRGGGRGNRERQPLPYKSWVQKHAPEDITPEEAGKQYEQYVAEYWKQHRDDWFERHKDDEDVRSAHDPRSLEHELLPLHSSVAFLSRLASRSFISSYRSETPAHSANGDAPPAADANAPADAEGDAASNDAFSSAAGASAPQDGSAAAAPLASAGAKTEADDADGSDPKHGTALARKGPDLKMEDELHEPVEQLVRHLDSEREVEESAGDVIATNSSRRLDYLSQVHGIDVMGRMELQLKELRTMLSTGGKVGDRSRRRAIREREAEDAASYAQRRLREGGWLELYLAREQAHQAVADIIEQSISQETESKFGCKQCSKYFKGPDFVRKHMRNKHAQLLEDEVDRVLERTYKRNFLLAKEEEDKHSQPSHAKQQHHAPRGFAAMGNARTVVVPGASQSHQPPPPPMSRKAQPGHSAPNYSDPDAKHSVRPTLDYGDL